MKLSEKVISLSVFEFMQFWCKCNPDIRRDSSSIVDLRWDNLQDQTSFFIEELEKSMEEKK